MIIIISIARRFPSREWCSDRPKYRYDKRDAAQSWRMVGQYEKGTHIYNITVMSMIKTVFKDVMVSRGLLLSGLFHTYVIVNNVLL